MCRFTPLVFAYSLSSSENNVYTSEKIFLRKPTYVLTQKNDPIVDVDRRELSLSSIFYSTTKPAGSFRSLVSYVDDTTEWKTGSQEETYLMCMSSFLFSLLCSFPLLCLTSNTHQTEQNQTIRKASNFNSSVFLPCGARATRRL